MSNAMNQRQTAPFGTWKSTITARTITAGTVGLGSVAVDGGTLYWLESRPEEDGRNVLVCRSRDGKITDLTPAPINVRSRVHEYGGGAYNVKDEHIIFVDLADQQVNLIEDGNSRPLTPTGEASLRYADFDIDTRRQRVLCIREDHRGDGEPVNAIVALNFTGDTTEGTVLIQGHDFFAYPRLSPNGRRLAWISWDHPNMPWDGTELWVADVGADGNLSAAQRIAGGHDIAVFQPAWSPDGVLHFVADPTGWWNLYAWHDGMAINLCPEKAEFGLPMWGLGTATYAFIKEGTIACRYTRAGEAKLGILTDGTLIGVTTPFVSMGTPALIGNLLALTGTGDTEPTQLILINLKTGTTETVRRSTTIDVEPGYVSTARPIAFPTADRRTAYAFFYPPANQDFHAIEGELPPLIVRSHGGPTAATGPGYSPAIQYWTSRGFAVADVNYGGSTGYGRVYREHLDGAWGIVDVDDCEAAALYLVDQGLADPARLIIRGGSAGGYTTLAALTFRDTFKAGASLYGIGDLMALAKDTHKFESRYLDRLIGPLPDAEALYAERSPLYHAESLNCPVIFFQGLDDKVVPPNQAKAMVAALEAKDIPVAYVHFEGEGHGFRKAENIIRALEAELSFYAQIFGFTPADDIDVVAIRNI
jgi:dipeptidyl aminopeptidase/acylaminoacyl peptidase